MTIYKFINFSVYQFSDHPQCALIAYVRTLQSSQIVFTVATASAITFSGPFGGVQQRWSIFGGAYRDRTDDIQLAKLALSHLS